MWEVKQSSGNIIFRITKPTKERNENNNDEKINNKNKFNLILNNIQESN